MSRERVPFGGLSALMSDELIGLESATEASNCVLDDGTIKGRSGYRKVAASAIGSGTAQWLSRYRHGPLNTPRYDAHNILVAAGVVYSISDPTTETGTDGVIETLGTLDATSGAVISGAQSGKNLYLASDTEGVAWCRIKPYATPPHAPAFETLKYLPKGDKPTKGTGLTALTKVYATDYPSGLSVSTGCTSATISGATNWKAITKADGSKLVANDYATVDTGITAGADWRDYGMVVFLVSPPSNSEGQGKVDIQLGDKNGIYKTIATTFDSSASEAGSPSVLYVNLVGIDTTFLQYIRYIRFTLSSGSGIMGIYGHVLVPTRPATGTVTYRTTFYDSATAQESSPTETLDVTMPTPSSFPEAVMAWRDGASWAVSASTSINPTTIPKGRNGNIDAGMVTPVKDDFAGAPQIVQSVPSAIQSAGACRLWRLTSGGYRLVKEETWSTTTTTVTFSDTYGDRVLSAQGYQATGTPPKCRAMSARSGRVVCSYDNRIYVSSFIPPSTTSDPYPSFPPEAIEESDGWSFDVTPSKSEQIAALVNGDAMYILSNEACYSMPDITPNSPCYTVVRRGVVSTRAAIYCEDRLFWASADGVYACANRSQWEELTQPVRRAYIDWLVPNSTTTMVYQDRKLYICVAGTNVTRYLRFDFVTGTWTRGSFGHEIALCASFSDPGVASGRAFLCTSTRYLERLQGSCTTDDGTAITAWIYQTGYLRVPVKCRLGRFLINAYGTKTVDGVDRAVTITAMKTPTGEDRAVTVYPNLTEEEYEAPFPADIAAYKWRIKLSAVNDLAVRLLEVGVDPVTQVGG